MCFLISPEGLYRELYFLGKSSIICSWVLRILFLESLLNKSLKGQVPTTKVSWMKSRLGMIHTLLHIVLYLFIYNFYAASPANRDINFLPAGCYCLDRTFQEVITIAHYLKMHGSSFVWFVQIKCTVENQQMSETKWEPIYSC